MKILLERLRSSLWPIPLAMLLGGIALVQVTSRIDAAVGERAMRFWWLHSGTGVDASSLLATLASAIITMSSVVFSIAIVALSLAANHFGTRLVRTYMSELTTKLSLGFFLLTVVFCLLGMRTVSDQMTRAEVPHVTVTVALVLSVGCVLVLVFFLHRAARSVVADDVIRRVAAELDASIEELAQAQDADAGECKGTIAAVDFERSGARLLSPSDGYVQEIRYDALAQAAAELGVFVRLDLLAGDYVCKDGWIGRVHPRDRLDGDAAAALLRHVVIGSERTPVQDLGFSIRHLVDVALRALSPGINDPNTALVVLDRLRGAVSRLLCKSLARGFVEDEAGECRVLSRARTHAEFIRLALRPIRDAAVDQPLVVVSLLEALAKIAEHVRGEEHARAVWQEATLVLELTRHTGAPSFEIASIEHAYSRVGTTLRAATDWAPPDAGKPELPG